MMPVFQGPDALAHERVVIVIERKGMRLFYSAGKRNGGEAFFTQRNPWAFAAHTGTRVKESQDCFYKDTHEWQSGRKCRILLVYG